MTLTRLGAQLVGLEVPPLPQKYEPIVLHGTEALATAEAIAKWLNSARCSECEHSPAWASVGRPPFALCGHAGCWCATVPPGMPLLTFENSPGAAR